MFKEYKELTPDELALFNYHFKKLWPNADIEKNMVECEVYIDFERQEVSAVGLYTPNKATLELLKHYSPWDYITEGRLQSNYYFNATTIPNIKNILYNHLNNKDIFTLVDVYDSPTIITLLKDSFYMCDILDTLEGDRMILMMKDRK